MVRDRRFSACTGAAATCSSSVLWRSSWGWISLSTAFKAYQKKEQTVPLTVEDIAASYIREVRAVQPEGPYFLGCFCFGGVVAFEMAQQLRAQGQDVALLALLDTKRPKYRPKEADRARQAFHARRLRSLGLLGYLRREVWRRRIRKITSGAGIA
jgi:hypothetical protein